MSGYSAIVQKAKDAVRDLEAIIIKHIESGKTERNRMLLLMIASLLIFDYLVFCYHIGRNPFNIFPSLPALDLQSEANIYLPDIDGKGMLKETRKIPSGENQENTVKALFGLVLQGSFVDNTTETVPLPLKIRNVWIHQSTCIIDLDYSFSEEPLKVIHGTEKTFKEAVRKTIMENIPEVKKVYILERGIPQRNLWEFSMQQ